MKKRLLSIVLAALLLLSCLPVFAAASDSALTVTVAPAGGEYPAKRADSNSTFIPYLDLENQTCVCGDTFYMHFLMVPNGKNNQYYNIEICDKDDKIVASLYDKPITGTDTMVVTISWPTGSNPAGEYHVYCGVSDSAGNFISSSIYEVTVYLVKNAIPLKTITVKDTDTGETVTGFRKMTLEDEPLWLSLEYNPYNATGKREMSIQVDKTDVVLVEDWAGFIVVTPIGIGKTTVTVTVDGVSAYFGIEVIGGITGLKIDKTSLNLLTGETAKLTATPLPAGVNMSGKTVKWSTGDAGIATVDQSGNVKGVKPGQTVITASVDGYAAKCTVNVVDASDPCARYTDVNRSMWYHSAVDYVISHGLMGSTRTDAYTFEPNTVCTRSMIVSVLYTLMDSPSVSYSPIFTDVPAGQWYTDAVIWAAQNDIVSGYGNGKFGPSDVVTREQLATVLYEFSLKYTTLPVSYASLNGFTDANKVTWSKNAMQWAVALGIISGKPVSGGVALDPQGKATRAEVATLLSGYLELLG